MGEFTMPTNIRVGLSQKAGLPNYGSLGATCEVTFEAEHGLLERDLDAFYDRVKDAFAACRQAVQEELARPPQPPAPNNGNGQTDESVQTGAAAPPAIRNGEARPAGGRPANGNGRPSARGASERQLDYARQLARSIQGFGAGRLDALAQSVCGKPMAALTSAEASELIHTLQALQTGEVELESLLSGAAA